MRSAGFAILLLVSIGEAAAEPPRSGRLVWERGPAAAGETRRIWISGLDGSGKRPLTDEGARRPSWSPDGHWIAYSDEADSAGRVVRPDGSDDRRICDGRPLFWLRQTSEVVCLVDGRYDRVDPTTGRKRTLFETTDFTGLGGKSLEIGAVSSDLRFAVGWSDRYRRRFRGDNGFFQAYHSAVLLDLRAPHKLYAIGRGCEPTLGPDDDWIYHVGASGTTAPDIFRVRVSAVVESDFVERRTELGYAAELGLADEDWGHTYFPRIATGKGGAWLVYAATRAADGQEACHDHDSCAYQIFLHRLGSSPPEPLRMTHNRDSNTWPHLFFGEDRGTATLLLR